MKKLILISLLIFAIPLTSLAWDRQGHQAVAAIAYAQLSKNHQSTINAINAILSNHPWRGTWQQEYQHSHPPGMTFENYAFIRAAAWPDDIRGNPAFHHATWHYVNFPVTLPSQVDINAPIGGDLMTQINACMDFVKNKTAPADRATRAIMLSWLEHLIGDMHQPLHTIALVSNFYPHGDHGGNSFFVKRTDDSAVTDLHTFWDHILGSSETVEGAAELAGQITAAFPANSAAISGDYRDWAKACAHLGLNNAYKFHGHAIAGSSDSDEAEALPDGYGPNAKRIAGQQVALGGYRLGSTFIGLLP